MGMWGASILSELAPAICSLVALNSRPLCVAAFGLPDDDRLTKELLLDVVRMYDEKWVDIPYL